MDQIVDIELLGKLEPMVSFSPVRLGELIAYCHVGQIQAGENPYKLFRLEGQLVYLLEGEIELVYQDGNKVSVTADSEWARHPLGKRQPPIVSATALCSARLLYIDENLLDRMMTWDQFSEHDLVVGGKGKEDARNHEAATVTSQRLLSSSMFSADNLKNGALAHLPAANISVLLQRFEAIRVNAGQAIVREGDEGDYYYLIDKGRAQVTRRVGGVDMSLAELHAGDVFGEEALVSDAKRNATVVMKSDGVLLRLGRSDFMSLLKEPLLHKVNYELAMHEVEKGAILLDVRHPPEYRYDRLRGAMNIPLTDIRNAIGVLDRNRKYIAYCQSGRRSAAAAFILAQAGYDVKVLENGLWSVPKQTQQQPE